MLYLQKLKKALVYNFYPHRKPAPNWNQFFFIPKVEDCLLRLQVDLVNVILLT